jgi:DNA uptake protein ComE-like DNA-binding protein
MSQRTKLSLILLVFALAGLAVWMVVSANRGRRPVDVNTASFAALDALPYLTPEAANGIIAGRPFASVDELLRVGGIGEKTLERIRKFVKVE